MTNSKKIIKDNDIEIFQLNENSIYQNGYVLGEMYKNKIDINIYYSLKESLYQNIKLKYNDLILNLIQKKVKVWINKLKNNYSIAIDEILGFSDSLGIKDDTLLEINVIVEIYDYMCTLLGVKSENYKNIWNLRILDLDPELTDIILNLNLPLTILVNKISDEFKYVSFCYIGFFNGHTSFINDTTVTTFSWNNLKLKDFLKNEIPPMFHIKYSVLKFNNLEDIHSNLKSSNIIYDGYVMLMNKDKIVLHDFDKKRNESEIKDTGISIISDYSFDIENNLLNFIENNFNNIPSQLRAFTVIYDFFYENFLINNNLANKKEFIIISKKEILGNN